MQYPFTDKLLVQGDTFSQARGCADRLVRAEVHRLAMSFPAVTLLVERLYNKFDQYQQKNSKYDQMYSDQKFECRILSTIRRGCSKADNPFLAIDNVKLKTSCAKTRENDVPANRHVWVNNMIYLRLRLIWAEDNLGNCCARDINRKP
jgi:hypothetical protein